MLRNRANPPDAILREVWQRTGDKPFARIDDVISHDGLTAMSEGYKRTAGFDKATLKELWVRAGRRLFVDSEQREL